MVKHSLGLVALLLCSISFAIAQVPVKNIHPDTNLRYAPIIGGDSSHSIQLDSTLVLARRGLHEEDFINQVLQDTSFYEAFRLLKTSTYQSNYNIRTFDKKGQTTAHIKKDILHDNSGPVYRQKIISQSDSGDVYKRNGKYRLYTLDMFSYIFDSQKDGDKVQHSSKTGPAHEGASSSAEEGYKQKLKQLIFRPGTKISGLPFVSDKTEIFSPSMRKYYTYTFFSATYLGSIPVYRFVCKAKPEYLQDKSVMIKELSTIFDKKNFQILGRFLDMNYENMLFSFDVKMNIEANYVGEQLLPVLVQYKGNWDVPFKKKEIASFDVVLKHAKQ